MILICNYTTIEPNKILLSFYHYLYHYYRASNNYYKVLSCIKQLQPKFSTIAIVVVVVDKII